MKVKEWYKSKVLWMNAVYLIVVVAGVFGFADFKPAPEVEQLGTIIVLILNMVLRWKTNVVLV